MAIEAEERPGHSPAEVEMPLMNGRHLAIEKRIVRSNKRQLRIAVGAVIGLAAITAAAVWYVHASHFESTDDAFVEGRVVPVAAKVEGYVVQLNVDDNQHVKAGDVIAQIDPREFQAALDEARAMVESSKSRLSDTRAKLDVLQAQVEQAKATLVAVEADNTFARQDAERYRAMSNGASSLQDRQRSQSIEAAAEAKVTGARSNVAAAVSAAREGSTSILVAESEIAVSQTKVKERELDLVYATIVAPQSGRIVRRTVENGAYLKAGQSLLAIVPDDMWVLANFKETQLAEMHAGQVVDLTLDAYPGRTFKGHVDSMQSGTGGRFSLLPPENATGNFVKVVQRLPVKIRFDDMDAALRSLLAPGMSAEPEVRVR